MSTSLDFMYKIKYSLPAEKAPTMWAMEKYMDFYLNDLKPIIEENTLQGKDGMHGLDTHTNAVVFRGIDYAIHIGREPMPVVFACALHDAARTTDGIDLEHGRAAVPIAIKVMKKFPELINKDDRLSIYSAILNHTTGTAAPDYISACLWDADRTRLAWRYGFEEKFFNTQRGKYAAQHYKAYADFVRKNFAWMHFSKEY